MATKRMIRVNPREPRKRIRARARKKPSFEQLFKMGEQGVKIVAAEIRRLMTTYPSLRFFIAQIWNEVERQAKPPLTKPRKRAVK
jgi:hypothetical protein